MSHHIIQYLLDKCFAKHCICSEHILVGTCCVLDAADLLGGVVGISASPGDRRPKISGSFRNNLTLYSQLDGN